MDEYIVYVMTDEQGRILAINSSAFLPNNEGWVEIDRGKGDRYHHAQGNYLQRPLTNDQGIRQYKLVDGEVVEREQEEIEADALSIVHTPSNLDILTEVLGDHEYRLCLMELGLPEGSF